MLIWSKQAYLNISQMGHMHVTCTSTLQDQEKSSCWILPDYSIGMWDWEFNCEDRIFAQCTNHGYTVSLHSVMSSQCIWHSLASLPSLGKGLICPLEDRKFMNSTVGQYQKLSLVPRPLPLFVCVQYNTRKQKSGKNREPWSYKWCQVDARWM